jgi:hypothetical protein
MCPADDQGRVSNLRKTSIVHAVDILHSEEVESVANIIQTFVYRLLISLISFSAGRSERRYSCQSV